MEIFSDGLPSLVAPVLDHLWQSTAFGGLMVVAALALRKNRAVVRFWLWLAASMKFLVPCSLLMEVGEVVRRQPALAAAPQLDRWAGIQDAGQAVFAPSSALTLPAAATAHSHAGLWLGFAGVIWACGFLFVAIRWVRQLRAIRSLVCNAKPIDLGLPIPTVSAVARLEPGVFGIFRPVLFLPEGITERLTPAQMQALFAHEMCHVRRRDNLWAKLHVLVEAIFWFHPLVWWLGARMIAEREAACDEAVLRSGAEAETYATSVLEVCRIYAASPMPAIAGITGADLKQRVLTIASQSFGRSLSPSKKLALSVLGVAALGTPIVFGLVRLPQLRMQVEKPSGPLLSYEVVSIKPYQPTGTTSVGSRVTGGILYGPDGFSARRATLLSLIQQAYGITQENQVVGAPGWANSDFYEIEAKVNGADVAEFGKLTRDQRRPMLQKLLADRCGLKVHVEQRELAAYALVVAKGGPKLTLNTATSDARNSFSTAWSSRPPRVSVTARGASIASIVMYASREVGRNVVDETGLTGKYDFTLQWEPSDTTGPMFRSPGGTGSTSDSSAEADSPAPSIFTALEEQVGLKLVPRNALVDVVVIDHLDRPVGN